MTEASSLTEVLVTEHAAIYAYGVLGARLDDRTRRAALAAYDAHRAWRDALQAALRSRGLAVPPPSASYELSVTGSPHALALAIRVETEMGVRWRDLVVATDDTGLRRLAVQALQESAVRATQWRRTGGVAPVTAALPGEG